MAEAQGQATKPRISFIPEPAEQSPLPPPKRRQSSRSESGNKRPRLSTEASHDGKNGDAPVAATPDRRHSQRKSGQVEERKRGQRLFGALIGTLSQSSSSTAQRRRADIEKKQQAKLKLQAEEYDEKKRKRFEELMVVRRREQKKFDKQSMQIRHSNLLAMARFLHTETEPPLYYKPWELLPEANAKIKSQIEEAEAIVDREAAEFAEQQQREQDSGDTNDAADIDQAMELKASETVGSEANPAEPSDAPLDKTTNNESFFTSEASLAPDVSENGKDIVDDNGEVVLEAEEDTVIY
ncbi:MAG: hypothetical protein M1830_004722 [Pleopsidium flavum]|nr:MAG: hypothetical protein M1830_004741 [Pleopsidium flavum]KAI9877127.1 MAG: hypothetical protein M1830_004722 [Pleopsidium flavum]